MPSAEVSRMPQSSISVRYTRSIDQDVLAGLQLYGRLKTEALSPEANQSVEDWLYWFRENPLGAGYFAIAKHDGKVIGFSSLIPVMMRFGERTVRGGKGEFFSVEPAFRRVKDPDTGMLVPMALFTQLRRWAHTQGVSVTFGVPTKAASIFSMLSGGKLIEHSCHRYRIGFGSLAGLSRHHRLIQYGAGPACTLLRAVGKTHMALRYRAAGTSTEWGQVEKFESVSVSADPKSNCVFHPTVDLINFRFPDSHYLKYAIRRDGHDVAQLVFSRPRRHGRARLAWWSTLDLPVRDLAAVCDDVLGQCRSLRPSVLEIVWPTGGGPLPWTPRSLGFLRQHTRRSYFVCCEDERLRTDRDARPWEYTGAYASMYQLG